MVTRLSDIVEPAPKFASYVMNITMELSRLFQSGAVQPDAQINQMIAGEGGSLYHLPYWDDLGSDEANLSSDDPAESATPEKMTSNKDIAIKHYRNFGVSSADLTAAVAGDDPQRRAAERVAYSWTRRHQKQLIATLQGVEADNVANNGGDMVNDISGVSNGQMITAEAILDTAQTMGDASENLALIICNSATSNLLKKQNLIDYIPDARGEVNIPTYLGYELIVDDGMPLAVDVYTTYLLGVGAIAYGESMPRVPAEVYRRPAQGNGEGVEELWTRRHYVMHPRGVAAQQAAISSAAKSPTNTALANATSWTRVYERKRVKIAILKHKLANAP